MYTCGMKLVKRACTVWGVPFSYYVTGRGNTIFVAPPFHSDVARIAPLVELLAGRYRVIIPELPGVANRSALPGKYEHTARTYAMFLTEMVRRLKIRKYTLIGLSLGAIIGIEMLTLRCPRPNKFISYGAPLAASDIHLPREMKLFLGLYRMVFRQRERAEWFARHVLVNPSVLRIVFGIKFLGQKGYRNIVRHQVHLTANMHPRAWVELIDDIFSYDYPKNGQRFAIPALHMFNKHDNILDVPSLSARLQRIFPMSTIALLEMKYHAPLGPIEKEVVARHMKPMMQFLHS